MTTTAPGPLFFLLIVWSPISGLRTQLPYESFSVDGMSSSVLEWQPTPNPHPCVKVSWW